MTDYTKLLSDFPEINPANYGDDEVNALNAWGIAAHTAIEALQEENALLEGTLESRERNIAALQAENERLKSIPMKYKRMEFNAQLQEENAVLQAKLDELSKQKPVGVVALYPDVVDWTGEEPPIGANLYAAPKALAPLTEEMLWGLKSKSNVTWKSVTQQTNKFTEQSEYVPVTRTEFNFLVFARAIEQAHGIGGTP